MAEELRASDLSPWTLNWIFPVAGDLPPVALGEGEETVYLTGVADRVDGWEHGGKLYLRVVDYKTGKKTFSLSDVWYGMGLQMLLYLFSLEKNGESRTGIRSCRRRALRSGAGRAALQAGKPERRRDRKGESQGEARSGLLLDDPRCLPPWNTGRFRNTCPSR